MLRHRRFWLIRALLSGTIFFSAAASVMGQTGSVSPIRLEPCEVAGAARNTKDKVLCATHQVFENRLAGSGRKINLKIVVYPALEANKDPDPFLYIPGGPGASATQDAPYIVQANPQIRRTRDMVFVDQRGTGGSHDLDCIFYDAGDLQTYLYYYFPLDEVKKCREELEKIADLKLYTTEHAIADLDEVRQGLGYAKINLFGGSYGTRAVLAYLKRFGQNVRSAVLHGVSPTNHFMPGPYPQDTERALNGIIDECLADERCRQAFPNLRTEVRTVLEQLLQSPAEAEVKHPQTGKMVKVKLSRDLAAEAVRYMLYQPSAALRIPLFIHLAATGNYNPLAEAAVFYRHVLVRTGGNGMYLTITCAEDLPWIKVEESKRSGTGTLLGNYRLEQQLEACALWVRAEIPKDYLEPTRSEVPILILTGQWDPVTPPAHGDTVAKYLPNSLHLIVPQGGHGWSGMEGTACLQNLMAEFYQRGTTSGLDTGCIKNMRRRDFQLALPK
jgi:pimeloyl-ACP methyl ester carboxylesterase